MYIVTKDLQDFCLTHRLGRGYIGKCRCLHGHNYSVQVTLGANGLDQYGMAIDFGTIKKLFNNWVQDNWDHAAIVSESDPTLLEFLKKENNKHFVISKDQNSTAEFMSRFLFDEFEGLLNKAIHEKMEQNKRLKNLQDVPDDCLTNGVQLLEVKVWETKDSFATWRRRESNRQQLYA